METIYQIIGFTILWLILGSIAVSAFFLFLVLFRWMFKYLSNVRWIVIAWNTIRYPFMMWQINNRLKKLSDDELVNLNARWLTDISETSVDRGAWYQKHIEKLIAKHL